MKKILGLFALMFLLMISSVNAGEVLFEQESLVTSYNFQEKGNTMLFDFAGFSDSETLGATTGDIKFEFEGMKTTHYIILESNLNLVNMTFNMSWQFADGGGVTTQELTILEGDGNYYFAVEPNYEGENGAVLFQFPALNGGNVISGVIYLQEEITYNGVSNIMVLLTTSVVDLIKINVNLWKLGYYIIIGGILLSIVFGLVFAGYKLYKFTEKKPRFETDRRR